MLIVVGRLGVFLAGKPPHAQVAQRGVQKREDNLEEPVRQNQREDVASGELGCQVPEGDELEDGGVYQLACYGGQVVADPQMLAMRDLAPEGEHEDIKLLGHREAHKRGYGHADGRAEYLSILLLKRIAFVGLDRDADCHHDEEQHKHDGGHVHEAAGLLSAEDLPYYVGDQEHDRNEEDADGDPDACNRGDLCAQRVDHDHAGHEQGKKKITLSVEFFIVGQFFVHVW